LEREVQQVRWSEKASDSLEDIYAFHAEKSELTAISVVEEIIEKAESINFPKQYQLDEFDSQCRRMFVGNYKILYQNEGLTVHIVNILCSKKPA
jgi:plasmid stabilization system protein ParE